MITEGETFAVQNLSLLLRGISLKHDSDYFCLNCLYSFRTENNSYIEMPEKGYNILKYNHGEKSMKFAYVIYADTESLLEIIDTCYNIPEKASKTKGNKHNACSYSLFTHYLFDSNIKNMIII